MTQDEYDAHRQRLGEELRAAIELAEEGYRARLRALDLALQGLAPDPAPPAPARPEKDKHRRRPHELQQEVVNLLPQLPEVFSKDDFAPLFTDPPDRASLFRVLQEMVWDGALQLEWRGQGRNPTQYRRKPRLQGT